MTSDFSGGTIDKILQTASAEQIGVLVIPSRRQQQTVDAHLQAFLAKVPVSSQRIFDYVPPDKTSSCPYGSDGGFDTPRHEKIPEIEDKGLHMVIIDCNTDSGRTLRSATEMLVGQGFNRDRIWYFGYFADIEPVRILHPAQDLLDYTSQRRKE